MTILDRRQFVRRVGAALALLVTGAGCARAPYDPAALARPDLLGALGGDAVRAIGARYRASASGERDADALRDAILASRSWTARLGLARSPSLAELVRDDFARGRTVLVSGWVLSATEARQCALFSLLPG